MKLKDLFKKYELRRKLVHILTGIISVWFINIDHYLIQNNLELLIILGLTIALLFSWTVKYLRPILILRLLTLFDKPKDILKFPGKGAIYYLIGLLLAVSLFHRDTASASILILALGDPAAYYFGTYHGKRRLIVNKQKVLEGTLAGTFFGTIAASLFVPFPLAFFGAAFGMMAEAIEINFFHLDDNFFIPLVSGSVISLIQILI